MKPKGANAISWMSLNGQPRRVILIAVTQSYKDFKGKFFRVRSGTACPYLLVDASGKEKFPLYWTKGPVSKLRHDPRWLTEAEKKDISILKNAQPMKCSEVLKLEDDEEGLFNYLCKLTLFLYFFVD